MKKRTAVALKWVGIVIVVLVIVYGALVVASRLALNRAYTALRADGRPMEAQDILPPEIPDTDNALVVYNAAVLMLRTEPPIELDGFTLPTNRPATLYDQLAVVSREVLKSASTNNIKPEHVAQLLDHPRVIEFLEAVERGAAKPGYRQRNPQFLVDYPALSRVPEDAHLTYVLAMYAIANTLSMRARRQAAAGQTEAAWRTLILGLRIADSLQNEPDWDSQWVRRGMSSVAMNAVQSVAEIAPPSADDSMRLDQLLKSFESRQPFVHGLDGERLIKYGGFFNLPFSQQVARLHDAGVPRLGAVIAVRSPLSTWLYTKFLRDMRNSTRRTAEPLAPGDEGQGPRWAVTLITRARITRAGLLLLRYKQEHGSFPADLHAIQLANEDDSLPSHSRKKKLD